MPHSTTDAPPERPNIVLIVADEWRGDVLGHAGDSVASTPVLDGLVADDAVSFLQTYCQSPVCVPSRTSFITGWYPHVAGHRTQHFLLQEHEPNLLRVLRDAGYAVWWAGKNDMLTEAALRSSCDVRRGNHGQAATGRSPGERVKERWGGDPARPGYYSHYAGRLPDETLEDDDAGHVAAAAAWVEEHLATNPQQPFLVLLTLFTPHCPYGIADPWFSLVDRAAVPAPLPPPQAEDRKSAAVEALRRRQHLQSWGEDQWRELRAVYYGMVARTDDLVGRLLAALHDLDAYDSTLLVLTSDHGDFAGDFGLPEKAQNLFDDSLVRVPLVIKPPLNVPVRAGVRDALVELVDLPATLYDLAGVAPGYDHFGRSLRPLLTDEAAIHRDAVLCEGGRLPNEAQATERESDQSVEGLYHPRMSLQAEDSTAHGKGVMWRTATHKLVLRTEEEDELYDLLDDRHEQHNRIHDPDLSDVATGLREDLLRALVRTADVVPHHADPR